MSWVGLASEPRFLGHRMNDEPDARTLTVLEERVMSLDDYPVTRMMELVIHTDDLATSAGVAPPVFSSDATNPVIDRLVETARRRHGDRAVLMALSRRERDPVEALRVL